eukprot:TRINITY_DN4500_c0_g1_i3.p1 TRINITY_DN4500_c0_g1~~TRINITY_DN4500_c0_g1_i3.p1  ORF type:complete len:546 (-),score=70.81 TRINITY_DN4500_c0_g1_i3:34-1671(-)
MFVSMANAKTVSTWPQSQRKHSGQLEDYERRQSPHLEAVGRVKAATGKKPKPISGVSELIFHDSTDVTHSTINTEPVHPGSGQNVFIEHLDLTYFKVNQCTITSMHNHKQCPYYHNNKDRKRTGVVYSAELCEFAGRDDGASCPDGDLCSKSHNRVEQLYRQDKYKTKFCSHFPSNIKACEYGVFCSFAHSEQDIIVELIHNLEYDDDFYMFYFKTVLCPFNLTQHDKAQCVYAHNWQDFRRKPQLHNYEPVACSNWKSTDFILSYEDGCPLGQQCTKCHGWKELEYHPLNYKTKQCGTKNCHKKGRDCPFYHTSRERRIIPTNVNLKFFKYAPRNRIISNTFKRRKDDLRDEPKGFSDKPWLIGGDLQPNTIPQPDTFIGGVSGLPNRFNAHNEPFQYNGSSDNSLNLCYQPFQPLFTNNFIQPKKFSTDEKQRNLSFEDRGEDLFGPKETTKSFPGTKFLSKETRRLHQGFMPNETDYHPVMVTDSNDELFKLILEHKTDAREQLMSRFDQKVECKSEEENMNEDQNDEDIGRDGTYSTPFFL